MVSLLYLLVRVRVYTDIGLYGRSLTATACLYGLKVPFREVFKDRITPD